jgi:hypothetical protein
MIDHVAGQNHLHHRARFVNGTRGKKNRKKKCADDDDIQ